MGFIDFLHQVGKLKGLKRTGWVIKGIKNPETVAAHSYRVTLMVMLLAKRFGVDEIKALKMALIHDIGESAIGDIRHEQGIKAILSKKEKFEREEKAVKNIFSDLEEGDELLDLWRQVETQSSPAGKFVKQIDKLETALQALEYDKQANLDEFWENTEKYLKDKDLTMFLNKLKKRRI